MRISVIIPCYNVQRYVARAVDSVLTQTHDDIEIICVDDGSTDGTLALLHELRTKHPERITVIEQSNKGACAARNTGLHQATGHYLQFLDADDVLMPVKLGHQAQLATAHGLPELIIGSSVTKDPDGRPIHRVIQQAGEHDDWLDLMAHRLNVTSTILWERNAVIEAGGWAEDLGSSQEYELMFRMLKNGARIVRDEALLTEIHKRMHGSIGQTNVRENWIRFIGLRAQVIEHIKSTRPATDLRPYQQVLFDSIRTLYPYDRKAALELYAKLLPTDFEPRTSPATGKGYLLLHGILGFDLANKFRSAMRSR